MTSLDVVAVDDLSGLRARLSASPDASRLRPVGLQAIVRGSGSIRALPSVLDRLGLPEHATVVVLSDTTPKRYGDRDVLDVVVEVVATSHHVDVELLHASSSGGVVLADEATVSDIVDRARRRAPDVLVSVGSGTVTDIAKVVAGALDVNHVVVQTAASVNGFTDDQSVLLINGAKRTTPSQWPAVLVVDPLVISLAPLTMSRSGLGDQLSMFTASADWYLSSAVGFETSFSPMLVDVMRDGVDELMVASTRLGHGDPQAVSDLANCLARGGIAMGVAGRTAPSSGLEHTISHLLEMHADAHHQPSASHGSQVGAASVFAALVWRRVQRRLAEGHVTLEANHVATRDRVLDAFSDLDESGTTGRECWNLYERKATWIRSHMGDLRRVVEGWSEHAVRVDQLLLSPDVVARALRDAGAPVTFRQLSPAPHDDVITWALHNCHLLRDRFGILDLADLMGVWSLDDALSVRNELDELAQSPVTS